MLGIFVAMSSGMESALTTAGTGGLPAGAGPVYTNPFNGGTVRLGDGRGSDDRLVALSLGVLGLLEVAVLSAWWVSRMESGFAAMSSATLAVVALVVGAAWAGDRASRRMR